ncbi:hypothetical protein [Halococcus sp. IIIV-5B]|uniref:hypothetical protein n=1 Tax=Halococcus sp. IIIV-5B TaxID=2321230 RepID=UPI000E75F473|nr:hypothetical protein [Halococcus sp. IIIV-5B]RJT07516.1 hypothetical protein D3261_02665 [Halococcus sp. IIIV-5B]
MTDNEDVEITEVQTVALRRQRADRGTVIVSIPEAIQAAGLEDGGSFRFDPGSVEEIGMLAAVGGEESVDGRSEPLARNIRKEGRDGETLRLVIPQKALSELVDPESIDWEDPPEVNVWAGERLLAFEIADTAERTINFDRGEATSRDE